MVWWMSGVVDVCVVDVVQSVGVTLGLGLGCLVIIMCRGLDDHGGLTQYDNLNE